MKKIALFINNKFQFIIRKRVQLQRINRFNLYIIRILYNKINPINNKIIIKIYI